MSQDELNFVAALLGGGVVSALITAIFAIWSARRQRELDLLQEQLGSLYGPLWFFTSQNQELSRLAGQASDASSNYFFGKWSEDESTQQNLLERAKATTDLSNSYIQRLLANNDRMMDILESNWSLVDPVDVPVFSMFQVDHTRFTVQIKEQGEKNVPFSVIYKLGPIVYMRGEMIEHVRIAVQRKQDRLARLTHLGHVRYVWSKVAGLFIRGVEWCKRLVRRGAKHPAENTK